MWKPNLRTQWFLRKDAASWDGQGKRRFSKAIDKNINDAWIVTVTLIFYLLYPTIVSNAFRCWRRARVREFVGIRGI